MDSSVFFEIYGSSATFGQPSSQAMVDIFNSERTVIAGLVARIFQPRGCHDSLWADFPLESSYPQVI